MFDGDIIDINKADLNWPSQIMKIQPIDFQWQMEDPFIFCAHHNDDYPKGNADQAITVPLRGRNVGSDFSGKDGWSMYHGETVPGFPAHPHRGFETVTIVLKGIVDHHDSKGARGRYGNGDVQWLTTGAGCQHSEMFPLVNTDKGNPLELFQIWLNLPAKDKFAPPAFKMLWNEDIPVLNVIGANGKYTKVRIIAGSMIGNDAIPPCPDSWAFKQENRVGIFLMRMFPDAVLYLSEGSETLNRNLYFYEGEGTITIDDTKISAGNRIKLAGNSEVKITNSDKEAYMLLLEGEPIKEPVVQYGPIVMNTEQEVRKAFEDFQATRFGGWKWNRPDPVNDINSGRFADYIDGTSERKG
ncbi:MAG: pirin family protein [Ignavibacteriaceae bacterium]